MGYLRSLMVFHELSAWPNRTDALLAMQRHSRQRENLQDSEIVLRTITTRSVELDGQSRSKSRNAFRPVFSTPPPHCQAESITFHKCAKRDPQWEAFPDIKVSQRSSGLDWVGIQFPYLMWSQPFLDSQGFCRLPPMDCVSRSSAFDFAPCCLLRGPELRSWRTADPTTDL